MQKSIEELRIEYHQAFKNMVDLDKREIAIIDQIEETSQPGASMRDHPDYLKYLEIKRLAEFWRFRRNYLWDRVFGQKLEGNHEVNITEKVSQWQKNDQIAVNL